MKTRAEHLRWCKDRALEYLDTGDIPNAIASMGSDLNDHPETRDHPAISLGLQLQMLPGGMSQEKAKEFIEGFN